jgi:hypothetical protein
MAQQSWTELFFLDEATALAAGHRPCFYCRKDDANRFRSAWEKGNRVQNVRMHDIDTVLHHERLDHGIKRLHALLVPLDQLPAGAMVQQGEESFLVTEGRALLWSPSGYSTVERQLGEATLLTPPSTLRTLNAGYQPTLHPTALS